MPNFDSGSDLVPTITTGKGGPTATRLDRRVAVGTLLLAVSSESYRHDYFYLFFTFVAPALPAPAQDDETEQKELQQLKEAVQLNMTGMF